MNNINERLCLKIDSIDHHLEVYREETRKSIAVLSSVADETVLNLNSSVERIENTIFQRSVIVAVLIISIFCLLGAALFFYVKILRLYKEIKHLQQSKCQETLKYDNKLVQLLEQNLSHHNNSKESDVDHSLVISISNEIARIETNLSRMDSSVRGYKQLVKGIERIKVQMVASDYEYIDMLGKTYHEGLVVDADFITDENLEEGVQVISGIIKPQVNYKGKMIQSAKIVVTQNL